MQINRIIEPLRNPVVRILFAIFMGGFASLMDIVFHLPGEASFVFFYFFPVFVAFFLFIFDRLIYRNDYLWVQWGIDGIVVILSILRAFYEVPLISGHAFFLTFAFVTIRSLSSRVFFLLVWLQVMYLKLAVLHDPTFLGGVIAGLVSAGIWYWIEKNIIGQKGY